LRNLWKRIELVSGIYGSEMNSFEESKEEKLTSVRTVRKRNELV
jgi:hypothetical protein